MRTGERERFRRHSDYCRECGGMMKGEVDLQTAHYEVTYPSRCKKKDACERIIISALSITPVVLPDGSILR